MVVLLSCSLIGMGGWIWIDNGWAFIPGVSDPAQASLEMAALFGAENGEVQIKAPPAEAEAALPVGLIEGNGDEDDDRVEPYAPPPFLAVRSQIQVALKKPAQVDRRQVASYKDMGQLKVAPPSISRIERRTLATYKDFGHLKVGPAGEVASTISRASTSNQGRSNSFWAALVFLKRNVITKKI
ncbi:MAG: hypothetical protein LBC90_04470 [Candidatus Adiutrix sp.]|nr:hypothetical protein [Candidatus Adiutrix sp.]